jgi:hypothetical protein
VKEKDVGLGTAATGRRMEKEGERSGERRMNREGLRKLYMLLLLLLSPLSPVPALVLDLRARVRGVVKEGKEGLSPAWRTGRAENPVPVPGVASSRWPTGEVARHEYGHVAITDDRPQANTASAPSRVYRADADMSAELEGCRPV